LSVTAQQDAEIVKPCDHALQFDPVNQENGDGNFLLTDMIEKSVLKILFGFSGHFLPVLFIGKCEVSGLLPDSPFGL
jgi:hypothetical protein